MRRRRTSAASDAQTARLSLVSGLANATSSHFCCLGCSECEAFAGFRLPKRDVIALLLPDLGWQMDFIIFAVLGVIFAIVGRRYWKPKSGDSADPTLNQRGVQYIGQVYVLQTAIENGHGRITVGDGSWLVSGPDLPIGARVRVSGVDGARLMVESA